MEVPLDTLDCGHVSTLGHLSESGRVQWKFPLDTSRVLLRMVVCLLKGLQRHFNIFFSPSLDPFWCSRGILVIFGVLGVFWVF